MSVVFKPEPHEVMVWPRQTQKHPATTASPSFPIEEGRVDEMEREGQEVNQVMSYVKPVEEESGDCRNCLLVAVCFLLTSLLRSVNCFRGYCEIYVLDVSILSVMHRKYPGA